jgi:hypothetical protein
MEKGLRIVPGRGEGPVVLSQLESKRPEVFFFDTCEIESRKSCEVRRVQLSDAAA